ncbi:MAG TPA: 50S ribosomal protein L29 [Candidatus Limnocylindrales bacterium]|jgi:large subunit ribosomal protein L29|nr:50S ribosomal protein L29 [Candidatus Limnocylindrales bacterium]
MGIDRIRGLTEAELVTELATAKRHLYDLRFQLATRQLTDYHQIPETRHEIARILSVMTERHLDAGAAARPAEPAPARPSRRPRALSRSRAASKEASAAAEPVTASASSTASSSAADTEAGS